MKIKLLMLAVASVLMFGCKENRLNNSTQTPLGLRKGDPQEKLVNPFQFMGERHNEFLESAWQYVQKTGDTTRSGMRKFIIGQFKAKSGIDFTEQLDLMVQRKKEMGDLDSYIQKSWLSDRGKDFVKSIFRLSEKLEAVDFPFEREMAVLEEQINTAKLSDTERDAIWQLAALASYSCAFWKEKFELSRGKADSTSRSFFGSIIRVVAPSHADILSGLIGILSGDSINDIIHYASSDSMYMAYYVSGL